MKVSLISPSWWISMFVCAFVTMIFIFFIKKLIAKTNIAPLQTLSEGV